VPRNGRLIFGIFAALAEFERELISGRTCRVLVASPSDLPEEC
jgi:DNA invertase Pin-like site-specific DNA recombinase